jgi:hypothetical protein
MLLWTPVPDPGTFRTMQTIREFDAQFLGDGACRRYRTAKRWLGKVSCVRSGATPIRLGCS